MLLTYTFTFNPETKEAVVSGNIDIQQALGILQGLVVSTLVQKAAAGNGAKPAEEVKTE